jgi:hypothetical protein
VLLKPYLNSLIRLAMGSAAALALSERAFAGNAFPVISAPTLDEFGLIALGVAVGIAGLITVFRRKK